MPNVKDITIMRIISRSAAIRIVISILVDSVDAGTETSSYKKTKKTFCYIIDDCNVGSDT